MQEHEIKALINDTRFTKVHSLWVASFIGPRLLLLIDNNEVQELNNNGEIH